MPTHFSCSPIVQHINICSRTLTFVNASPYSLINDIIYILLCCSTPQEKQYIIKIGPNIYKNYYIDNSSWVSLLCPIIHNLTVIFQVCYHHLIHPSMICTLGSTTTTTTTTTIDEGRCIIYVPNISKQNFNHCTG